MADPAVVERLAGLKILKNVPRSELEWLVAHGKIEEYEAGKVFRPHDRELPGLTILLTGSVAIHIDRMGVQRRVAVLADGEPAG